MAEGDWNEHKLLITQEIKDLKKGQADTKEMVMEIKSAVTVLQVKLYTGTAILAIAVNIGVFLLKGLING